MLKPPKKTYAKNILFAVYPVNRKSILVSREFIGGVENLLYISTEIF